MGATKTPQQNHHWAPPVLIPGGLRNGAPRERLPGALPVPRDAGARVARWMREDPAVDGRLKHGKPRKKSRGFPWWFLGGL